MLPAELPEALTRGELDLALLEQVDVPLRIAMKVRHIEAIRCCVVLLSTHPLAKRRSLGLEDLARETWLSWDPARFPGRRERLLETAMTLGLRPCIAMEVENEETLFEQVTLGNGIGYLGHRSEGLPEGLVQVPLVHAGLEFPVFIAWRKDADQIAKLEALARELLGRDG